jgi:hypothetical protein
LLDGRRGGEVHSVRPAQCSQHEGTERHSPVASVKGAIGALEGWSPPVLAPYGPERVYTPLQPALTAQCPGLSLLAGVYLP